MLAARRTAKVPGRITFLIVSIITINGIRAKGVPWGTKWANICLECWIHPNNIRVTHKGKERDSVITMCLDLVNTYGANPRKLLNTIMEKRETNKIDEPIWDGSSRALNSAWRVEITFLQRSDHRDGEAQ